MNRPAIDSIKVKAMDDDCTDIDHLGRYTDLRDPWVICRHCGQYLYHAEKWDRICEAIDNHALNIGTDLGRYTTLETDTITEKVYAALNKARHRLSEKRHDYEPISRGYYPYFLPYAGGEKQGCKEYQEHGLQDYARAKAYSNGDWQYIGIRAEAVVSYDTGNGDRRIETLTSGGLWGIESDGSQDYIIAVVDEELAELKSHLEQFSIDTANWDELTKGIELSR